MLHASQDFDLSYIPREKGYVTIGGLRVLLVGDSFFTDVGKDSIHTGDVMPTGRVVTLKEWDVVAEVWVSS